MAQEVEINGDRPQFVSREATVQKALKRRAEQKRRAKELQCTNVQKPA
jgi:hypothetical protein